MAQTNDEGEAPNTVEEIIEGAGVDEETARFIHAIETGEIEGDVFELEEGDTSDLDEGGE